MTQDNERKAFYAGAQAMLDRVEQLYRQKAKDAASKPGGTVKDNWDRIAVPQELNAQADEIAGLELPVYPGGEGADKAARR